MRYASAVQTKPSECPPNAGPFLFATLAQSLLAIILASRRRGKRRERDWLTVMLHEAIDPNRARAGGLLAELEAVPA